MSNNIGKANVLVVDDDLVLSKSLELRLSKEGIHVKCVPTSQKAIQLVKSQTTPVDVIFMDQVLGPDSVQDGIETMKTIKLINPSLEIVMITAFGQQEVAINAIRCGAYRYIYKPYQVDELIAIVKSLVAIKELKKENQSLKNEVSDWKASSIKLLLCTAFALISLITLGLVFPKDKFLVFAFIVILVLMLIGWQGISKVVMNTILKMRVESKS